MIQQFSLATTTIFNLLQPKQHDPIFLITNHKKKKKWSIFHLQNNYDTMLTLTIKKTANFQSFPYVIQQFYPLSATKAANFQSSTIKTTTSKQAKKQTKKQKKVTQVERQRLTYSSRTCLHSAAYRRPTDATSDSFSKQA